MATTEVMFVGHPDPSGEETSPAQPRVDVSVTADVKVIQYGSTDDLESPKVEIVTNLDAIFKGSTANKEFLPSEVDKKSNLINLAASRSEDDNFTYQPILRRSQKSTQLNIKSEIHFKRSQINRILLLPYTGCVMKEYVKSKKRFAALKQSKSCGSIFNSSRNLKYVYSNSLDNISVIKKETRFSKRMPAHNATNPGKTFHEIINIHNISELAGNNQIKPTPLTDQLKDVNNRDEINKGLEDLIASFLSSKTTRNVSILHRPQTRNKTTSTTSLNKYSTQQIMKSSSARFLSPYISSGKKIPSELILKLVPKNIIHESKESVLGNELINSKTGLSPPQKKLGNKNILFGCFSKSRNKEDTDDEYSHHGIYQESYFPSAVEFHKPKKSRKMVTDVQSDIATLKSLESEMRKRKIFKRG